MIAVQASGLVKRFDETCAIDGVDLVVDGGEIRGLLGPNGAGKTTLLRMLLGLVAPDAGAVELFGRPRSAHGPVLLDGVAGFVEEPSFYPYLSGRANLELLSELDGGVSLERIDEVLERVNLGQASPRRFSGYSTGMRQRLGIAASLLRRPRLLLLDEPSSGLDPAGAGDVLALLRELAQDGVAVLLSSHQLTELEEVCDSFTMLSGGRVVWSGSAAQLRARSAVCAYRLTTSDDRRAVEIGRSHADLQIVASSDGGLTATMPGRELDPYVLALGRAGVAVRRLEPLTDSLESLFLALTSEAGPRSTLGPRTAAIP